MIYEFVDRIGVEYVQLSLGWIHIAYSKMATCCGKRLMQTTNYTGPTFLPTQVRIVQ
jgi:hypothetical protein